MDTFDVAVIGAGAAGMMCAFQAGRRGRKVVLLEHSETLGRKILISGGGRCNFTNIGAGPDQFVSKNPAFCRSALARFTPEDFIRIVQTHGISFHEKKLGQLFCDKSAQEIVDLLVAQCKGAGVTFHLGCQVHSIASKATGGLGRPSIRQQGRSGHFEIHARNEDTTLAGSVKPQHPQGPMPDTGLPHDGTRGLRFLIQSSAGDFAAESLVIATGGLSVPKVGATDFGYRIAEQFGLKVVVPAPALDGFVFAQADQKRFEGLAGVSLDTTVACGDASFRENILFTHSGLSGPAALQASLYWHAGSTVAVNFLPDLTGNELLEWFAEKKRRGAKAEMKNLLAELLPKSFCEKFCEAYLPTSTPLPQLPGKTLEEFCRLLQNWEFIPARTVGYQRAEVTRGGVDTDELSSKTMEAKKAPGLYFIGEVVDVTGRLGGYNFQWAWSSGWAAGQAV